MSAAVSNLITRIICQNHGSMDYKNLGQSIRQDVTISESMLCNLLRDTSKFIIIEGKLKGAANNAVSPDSLIIAKTALRLCKEPPDRCKNCVNLHLCRYLVCGSCKFGNSCKNSHDLGSVYNREVCSRHGVQDLRPAELFALLLQNDSSLLPEVCSHYNKGDGEHGSCRFGASCKGLHVCQHFLLGDCTFGERCKRNHALHAGAMETVRRRGVAVEDARLLRLIYGNALAIAGPAGPRSAVEGLCARGGQTECAPAPVPTPKKGRSRQPSAAPVCEADRSEICLFFLRRHCSFKEKCVRVHYYLPYRWQVSEGAGDAWTDLVDMEDVEQAYCNPANDSSKGISPVDFLTMTCGASKVRRLSTVSSVTKPPYYILTTDWLWSWQDGQRRWIEFGSEAGADASSVTSEMLENVYLAGDDAEIPFTAGNQSYILHFKDMVQQNVKSNTRRPVRRRPRFLSRKEVEKKLKSALPEASGDQEALPDFDYKLTRLSATSVEFAQVQKPFKRTMPSSTVHSIQRIENPSLDRVFQWQKEKMQKQSGGRLVDQRLLFHGTEHSLTQAICEQNFDWRVCGVHGTQYGKGSYFARDASYSDRFSKSNGKTKIMFAVQVLVGEYARGDRSYVRPPPKRPDAFYDSCVDSVQNPAIFVIFEKHQINPQYIIEYSP